MSADLIERLEAATAGEQRMLLLEAWLSLNPEPADWGDKDWRTWWTNKHRFRSMLDAEAYESAALTLVPEGWGGAIHFSENREHSVVKLGRSYPTNADAIAEGRAFALAICIAALKATQGAKP